MAESFARTVTGQMRARYAASVGLASGAAACLRAVREMTGSLTATAGYFGALFGGGDRRDIDRTRRLGRTIGIAVQISDDVAVIAGDGSPRRYSLPVLYALQERGLGPDRLRCLMSEPDSPASERQHAGNREVLDLVRASAGVAKAARVVARYSRRAEDDLTALPDSAGKRALSALVDHVRDRPSK